MWKLKNLDSRFSNSIGEFYQTILLRKTRSRILWKSYEACFSLKFLTNFKWIKITLNHYDYYSDSDFDYDNDYDSQASDENLGKHDEGWHELDDYDEYDKEKSYEKSEGKDDEKAEEEEALGNQSFQFQFKFFDCIVI